MHFLRGASEAIIDADAAIPGLEQKERIGAEEAVTAEALAADDAFEQERPVAALELVERGDGREGIAQQLAIDRHHAVLAREFEVFGQAREIAHAGLAEHWW